MIRSIDVTLPPKPDITAVPVCPDCRKIEEGPVYSEYVPCAIHRTHPENSGETVIVRGK